MFLCPHSTLGLFAIEWQELLPTFARIFNLLLFVGLLYFLLRRTLSEAFRARQEGIRNDLMRAEEERNAAVAKLEEVEGRLKRLGAEVEAIRAQAQREAAEERARIERATEEEIEERKREIQAQADDARVTLEGEARRAAASISSQVLRK